MDSYQIIYMLFPLVERKHSWAPKKRIFLLCKLPTSHGFTCLALGWLAESCEQALIRAKHVILSRFAQVATELLFGAMRAMQARSRHVDGDLPRSWKPATLSQQQNAATAKAAVSRDGSDGSSLTVDASQVSDLLALPARK
ncbi:unnamed protein product [Durusdinium trenchii]|uniref:Uncharacterized protein n=1 Tax=Durusdinium trenchii TaxID=1381693 RepID=A0ABP0Q3R5_9DINO